MQKRCRSLSPGWQIKKGAPSALLTKMSSCGQSKDPYFYEPRSRLKRRPPGAARPSSGRVLTDAVFLRVLCVKGLASYPCESVQIRGKTTPQNTSPRDDAPPAPTCSAPAPAKNQKSAELPHSFQGKAAQTISSDPPDSGKPDTQTNIETRDTSDETNLESPPHPRPQFPTLRASSYDAAPPAPPPSPHSNRANTNTSYTPHPQTTSESPPMP